MKVEKVKVRSDKQIVDIVEVPEFETLQEAIDKLGGGNQEEGTKIVLGLINTQNGTNIKNAARSRATSAPSKEEVRMSATMRLMETDEGRAKLQACAGDMGKLETLLKEVGDSILGELETKRAQRAQEIAEANKDDKDND